MLLLVCVGIIDEFGVVIIVFSGLHIGIFDESPKILSPVYIGILRLKPFLRHNLVTDGVLLGMSKGSGVTI